MKAVTLHQPWASLMAMGLKTNETRSWFTRYRGTIAIHAGKKNWCKSPFQTISVFGGELNKEETDKLQPILLGGHNLPVGAILAYADLVYCRKMVDAFATDLVREQSGTTVIAIADQTPLERKLGDWTEGRFAWGFENFRKLDEPIPCKGSQGLWEYTP